MSWCENQGLACNQCLLIHDGTLVQCIVKDSTRWAFSTKNLPRNVDCGTQGRLQAGYTFLCQCTLNFDNGLEIRTEILHLFILCRLVCTYILS